MNDGALRESCSQGRVPLQYATGNGRVDIVELFIRHNADVDIGDNHGATALHLASDAVSVEIVEALLAAETMTKTRT